MGGCYSTTLGSALHELGHALNLVHAETGIMARGFEDIDVFFTVKNQFFSPPMTVGRFILPFNEHEGYKQL